MLTIGDEEVRLTSPDRVVFPLQGWTKLDVAHHFRVVAEGCLRGVYGRPTMMKRYMKNVDTPPIYHKRASPKSPFETADIRFPSQRPGRMNVPRTPADIVRFVQLGCLDLHPWPVRAEDLDHPDELRFDLDPTDGFTFGDVRQVALHAKELLDELGLVGWPKTSGSRGIHVYVRIEPLWDFFQTRRAVLAFGRELERRHPRLVTTKWWKEERRGIFVDYNQNAHDKTVSSAYGVRPTGYVSAPVTWRNCPMSRYRTSRWTASPIATTRSATSPRGSTRLPDASTGCWSGWRGTRPPARATLPGRPTIPKCRVSRQGCSRQRW